MPLPTPFTVASRLYAVGTYGPFALPAGALAGVQRLVCTLSVENWPAALPTVAAVRVRWQMPDGTEYGADLPVNSVQRNRDGTPRALAPIVLQVPREGDGVAAVTGATIAMDAVQAFRTAITLRAE